MTDPESTGPVQGREGGSLINLADVEEYPKPKAFSDGFKKRQGLFHIRGKCFVRLLTSVT